METADRLAKQEADATLKQAICGFLTEYGLPDQELVKAQKAGAPPNSAQLSHLPGTSMRLGIFT